MRTGGGGALSRAHALSYAKWTIKALTPPILLLALKVVRIKLGLRKPDAPPEPDAPPAGEEAPREWEYVPDGWVRQSTDRRVKGWNVEAISEAYRGKWPSYLAALEGAAPLAVSHEAAAGESVTTDDHSAHNTLVSYAYVLALAAHAKERVSILDWGGGIGHYYPLSASAIPGVEIDYHCKDVPVLTAHGRELFSEATFYDDESCLERRYDLVLASASLQYAIEWRETLVGLAAATGRYLYVTRLPIARESPSFVVLQRAYAYGYDTEYLGWVIARDELLRAAEDAGLSLVREFLLSAWFSAAGAPEDPVEHRGYLFAPRTS